MGSMATTLTILFPWLLVAGGGWLVWQLISQNGRIVLRLEAIESRLAQVAHPAAMLPELPVGARAPEFTLPNLEGVQQSLTGFAGRRLLLVFFDPHCHFCLELAADLARIPLDGADNTPLPVIVSGGTAEDNQLMADEVGLQCPILLSRESNVALKYGAPDTPSAYLIDWEGRIASAKAVGRDAITSLVSSRAAESGEESTRDGNGAADYAVGTRHQGTSNGHAPRLASQAWNLVQAMADFAADGFTRVTEEEYRERLSVCDTCDRRQDNRCLECGCYLRLKARGRAFNCPLGKWHGQESLAAS